MQNNDIIKAIIDYNFSHKDIKPDYKKFREAAKEKTIFQQSDFRNDVKTEEDLLKLLGRKWKKNLGLLISFVDCYRHISGRENIYEIPISQNSQFLNNIFKSQKNISLVLKLAQKVDLLKCTFENCSYTYNLSKCYIFNKQVEDLIIDVCNKHSITHKQFYRNHVITKSNNCSQTIKVEINLNNGSNIRDTAQNDEINDSFAIRINSETKMKLPHWTDEQALEYLAEAYPQIPDYQRLANEINEKYYTNENMRFGHKFEPKIKRDKLGLIESFSIRDTNSICSAKEHDNGKETNKAWRKDILDSYFGKGNWMEYDVKSSIYRLTHVLNFNVWLPNNIDLYREMYGKDFETDEERRKFKSFCMRLYFGKSSSQIRSNFLKYGACKEDAYQFEAKHGGKDMIDMQIAQMKQTMVNTIGSLYSSEIFLHESCIYMELSKELLDRGFKVIQVYDGFYVDKKISQEQFQNLCEQMLDKIILKYKSKYLNNNKQRDNQTNTNNNNCSQTIKYEINLNNGSNIRDNTQISSKTAISNYSDANDDFEYYLDELLEDDTVTIS